MDQVSKVWKDHFQSIDLWTLLDKVEASIEDNVGASIEDNVQLYV